jgi:hypothetical protein
MRFYLTGVGLDITTEREKADSKLIKHEDPSRQKED